MVVDMEKAKNLMDLMAQCPERGVVLCNLCATKLSSRMRGAK